MCFRTDLERNVLREVLYIQLTRLGPPRENDQGVKHFRVTDESYLAGGFGKASGGDNVGLGNLKGTLELWQENKWNWTKNASFVFNFLGVT